MEHIINSVGSRDFQYPQNIQLNDTLLFNASSNEGDYTGKIHCWNVPFNCRVRIEIYGARGGNGSLGLGGFSSSRRGGYGAKISGEFTLKKLDQILILVGVAASHASTSAIFWANCVSGAGGGGTFVAKHVTDNSSQYQFIGDSDTNTNAYKGWFVEPLIVAAGGNGGHDHSSFAGGPNGQYNGQGRTLDDERLPVNTLNSQVGGGFSKSVRGSASDPDSLDGNSFLCGGRGSPQYSKHYLESHAGFGGGAANEETIGGGAGGWIPGSRDSAAYSWCSNQALNVNSVADTNDNHGKAIITILEIFPDNVDNISVFDNNKFNSSNLTNCLIFANTKRHQISKGYVKTESGFWKPIN